jgi:alkanesulfonate monooxygenase SsuD/methylene tetrahydromethanopterin reductase-like flavin-dependent oxidoreductase (luciferase family)
MRFGVVLPIQDVQEPLDVLLDQLRAEVRAADEAGFDAFFLPEFHQTRADGVISPLPTGAALAEGTRRAVRHHRMARALAGARDTCPVRQYKA